VSKTLHWVFLGAAVVNAVVVGLLVAVTQDKRVFPVVVGVGVCGTVLTVVWRWWRGPFRADILRMIGDGPTALYLIPLVAGLIVQGGFLTVFVGVFLQTEAHPCVCFADQRGGEWLNVTVGAGVFSWVESIMLFLFIAVLYRLIRGRQTPQV
jgi:hypothetical protein